VRLGRPKLARWDADRLSTATLARGGPVGSLGRTVSPEYGGPCESVTAPGCHAGEVVRVGAADLQSGFTTNDDIVVGYLLRHRTEEQKQRLLPGFVAGQSIGAIALTEPNAGSDLLGIETRATRSDSGCVLSGSKTLITNGILASAPRCRVHGVLPLRGQERAPSFERGRRVDKMGLHAQDTAELFFGNFEVPETNLLGEVGQGLNYLMQSPIASFGSAVNAQAGAEVVLG
jgi:acyl-CoA dehydrogenase